MYMYIMRLNINPSVEINVLWAIKSLVSGITPLAKHLKHSLWDVKSYNVGLNKL